MKSVILSIVFLVALASSTLHLSAQPKAQLYVLGIDMGFASFQASVALGEMNNYNVIVNAMTLSNQSLNHALGVATDLNGSNNHFLKIDALSELVFHSPSISDATISEDKLKIKGFYNGIVSSREGFTPQLAKQN